MNLTLEYIKNVCGGKLSAAADKNRTVNAFYTDSRTPSDDKLFLALRGEKVDGNAFVPALLEKGFCAMTDREENLEVGGDCLYVEDVRTALQFLAKHYRETELGKIPFVGITGSVGKTTTKDMVALALSSSLSVHKTAGNFNSQIGLPQTVLACPLDSGCAVVELGMSMHGEMERISRCAKPDISIITNIGHSHIENLGSREAIRDEKVKIAMFSDSEACLLLNGDEPLLKSVDYGSKTVYYVSVEDSSNDCYAENIIESIDGLSFDAVIFGTIYNVKLEVCGRHYVINSLFALATAHLLGVDVQKAVDSLSEYKSDGRRQFVYESDGHTVISDCYNASPESMNAALSVLKVSKGRRIAVLGDMLELGDETVDLHKLVGSYTSSSADVVVTYGDLAKNIAEASAVREKYSFGPDEREEMKAFLLGFIKENDTVLYKASNGMKLIDLIV